MIVMSYINDNTNKEVLTMETQTELLKRLRESIPQEINESLDDDDLTCKALWFLISNADDVFNSDE